MKHIKYLRYVLKHKLYVFHHCMQHSGLVLNPLHGGHNPFLALRLIWQGLIHDWSKFLPSEWMPYTNFFYACPEFKLENGEWRVAEAFNAAWLKHQHRSPHHWQHWVLNNDDGTTTVLEMPMRYAIEMICDWKGVGSVFGTSTVDWYRQNRDKMMLHDNTRRFVETQICGQVLWPKMKEDPLQKERDELHERMAHVEKYVVGVVMLIYSTMPGKQFSYDEDFAINFVNDENLGVSWNKDPYTRHVTISVIKKPV